MIHEGQLVLFRFPRTDQQAGRLRPAVVICSVPGVYDDWLVCMVSSQLHQRVEGFDEVLEEEAGDFQQSGLKTASVIRIGRLAVVERTALLGSIGEIAEERLRRIRSRLAAWLSGPSASADAG
jgi:mRNA interferase MazF